MALGFRNDAICLSGLTGSKIKCEVIGAYYPFWWNITSGGPSAKYEYQTTIVELDAATGEVYIEDTGETLLGSSGHALELKCSNDNARKLKVVLVEKDPDCYIHLKRVINRRWKQINVDEAEGPLYQNMSKVFLLNNELDAALNVIERINLGNALFFFDPLRGVEFQTIEKVARKRIKGYYETGTEFIIFVFTSDWFLGRDEFAGLPLTTDSSKWSLEEANTVNEADALFGNTDWRNQILNNNPIYERESTLIELYRDRLHKWFRYVLPMPFNPKENQIFHLILCSNVDIGVRATRGFFCDFTRNPDYKPDNNAAYARFRELHPELLEGLRGNQRPKQWRVLWSTIRGHEEGICDRICSDFQKIEQDEEQRQKLLDWLERNEYLATYATNNVWKLPIQQYRLNWRTISTKLGVDIPPPLEPLSLKPLSLKEISE